MFDRPDLELHGVTHVDGRELLCEHCDSGVALEVAKRGFREVWPAFVTCLSCGRGEDSDLITNGLVDAVLAARTGRKTAEDRDTFRAEWRGIVMTGELRPELIADDLVQGGRELRDAVTADVKNRWREKKKQTKTRARTAKKQATGAARKAAGTATATALTTAWTLQTGGAGPAKKPRARRCTVKGCRGGMVTLSTRIHSPAGSTRDVQIPCGVCHRS